MCSWRWTEWSSCQVLCDLNGQEPVGPRENRTREKFFPDDPHNECQGGQEVKECDQECQSEIVTKSSNYRAHSSAPFSFGNWISTPYCNTSCGENRYYLEGRSCTPTSPNLPKGYTCDSLERSKIHRPNGTACPSMACIPGKSL